MAGKCRKTIENSEFVALTDVAPIIDVNDMSKEDY